MRPEQDQLIEQLYQQYFDDLILYAIASLKNESRAQDIVQDAFHEAILRADVLMQHDNPKGWLMLTVKHKIKEYQRELQRYMKYFISLDKDLFIEPGKEDPRLEQPLQGEEEKLPTLKEIETTLTPEEFYLLKRLTIDQASHLELAKELGISIYASQKRLERIRKKLRAHFSKKLSQNS